MSFPEITDVRSRRILGLDDSKGPGWKLIANDALDVLPRMESGSFDAMVTDPPAGISFMGKEWDGSKGGRDEWVQAFAAIFSECLRVLKPGAHALIWAIPRTSHWTATALEDAGFEVRDVLTHHFGTGFPKSLDVSKAIDKAIGAKRQVVVGSRDGYVRKPRATAPGGATRTAVRTMSTPVTSAAREWEGWGTALKPASEHWILARRPLVGTVAANVLEHGTGALNVDGCRVGTAEDKEKSARHGHADKESPVHVFGPKRMHAEFDGKGRWPPNLLLTHSAGCMSVGTRQVKTGIAVQQNRDGEVHNQVYGARRMPPVENATYASGDGTEEIQAWKCAPGCPVAEMDRQSGKTKGTARTGFPGGHTFGGTEMKAQVGTWFGDSGGASRFFPCFRYAAKAGTRERSIGLPEGEKNSHPTVKALALMCWLCRLVTPPGGTVLDPFAGSGSTGVAALVEGFEFVGIEREAEYARIAAARLKAGGCQ